MPAFMCSYFSGISGRYPREMTIEPICRKISDLARFVYRFEPAWVPVNSHKLLFAGQQVIRLPVQFIQIYIF